MLTMRVEVGYPSSFESVESAFGAFELRNVVNFASIERLCEEGLCLNAR